jgi:molybdate transport system substrate-binding protein
MQSAAQVSISIPPNPSPLVIPRAPRNPYSAACSRLTALVACLLLFAPLAAAQTLSVAAASDLQFALKDIAARYEKETGTHIQITFGSSGNFFAQIQNGAPFDLFFSADLDYPQKLAAAGLADPATLSEYASGKIVLWTRNDSPIDLTEGLRVVLNLRVRKIAIANPDHAPYGRAAVAALQHEDLYERVRTKLVLGENISQAAQFADSGSADVGIIALSLALAPAMKERGKYVELPADSYPPLRQACVVLKSSPHQAVARAFLAFLKKPDTIALLKANGFSQ